MLMLMRSEGGEAAVNCDDEMIALACQLGTDACPAECKDNSNDETNTDEKVKSGDLAVEADAAANRKILKTWTSDLDTLTFKTSEEVEISKITLERYGYSESDQITEVRLEDQDGNIIADGKSLTKDKVTLNIKKDYRKVDGDFEATVVVTTSGAAGTIGFKVTDVESTAKNLNLDDYNPYTYEVVEYVGSTVTVELKGSNKTYNYEDWESYEVARLKVSAGDNAVLIKGFTLTNAGKVDMKESLDELTVKADSKEIKAKASVNKDDELVVSFNEDVLIDINKKVTFVLEASFKDFDDYGESVEYYIAEEGDFNAVEKKNGTRVNLDITKSNKSAKHTTYTFNGWKIKLSNTKLWNVDAAQASEGTIVAEGTITITEPISKLSFSVTWSSQWAENLTLVINGDEFEGKRTTVGGTNLVWSGDVNTCFSGATATTYTKAQCKGLSDDAQAVFTFNNVNIDESGKIQFKVDIYDNERAANKTLQFSPSFNGDIISGAKYDNVSKQYVKAGDVAGSIAFSKVTIQPAKASLENNITKDVEFIYNETNTKVVFDGTYTAKKADIDLNKFIVTTGSAINADHKVKFYLYIDGEEIADADAGVEEPFSDIRIKAGESVKVKVEAEVEAYDKNNQSYTFPTFTLELRGTDVNGNEDTGKGSDDLVTMKVKASGSTTVDTASSKNTVLLKAKNQTIAEFTVKPSNKDDEDLTLDDLAVVVTTEDGTALTGGQIKVKVAGSEIDEVDQADIAAYNNANITSGVYYIPNEKIGSSVKVEIILKDKFSWKVELTELWVNGKKTTRTFTKNYAESLVYIDSQEDLKWSTKYIFGVEKSETDDEIKCFAMFTWTANITSWAIFDWSNCVNLSGAIKVLDIVDNWDDLEVSATDSTALINRIAYIVQYEENGTTKYDFVNIDKTTYNDYFKVGSEYAKIFKNP